MSIIYSTISPFLLSILVFYPWALALVIWQLGTHDAQSRKNEKSSTQTVECRSQESVLPCTAAYQDQKDTATATSAEFFRSMSFVPIVMCLFVPAALLLFEFLAHPRRSFRSRNLWIRHVTASGISARC
jgi:hypothetical protein